MDGMGNDSKYHTVSSRLPNRPSTCLFLWSDRTWLDEFKSVSRAGVSFGIFGVDALEPKEKTKRSMEIYTYIYMEALPLTTADGVATRDKCLFLVKVKGILHMNSITCCIFKTKIKATVQYQLWFESIWFPFDTLPRPQWCGHLDFFLALATWSISTIRIQSLALPKMDLWPMVGWKSSSCMNFHGKQTSHPSSSLPGLKRRLTPAWLCPLAVVPEHHGVVGDSGPSALNFMGCNGKCPP